MGYRWINPKKKGSVHATYVQAQDSAVFNAMIGDGRIRSSNDASARYRRLSEVELALAWKSLEKNGWKIEVAQ